MCPHCLSNPSQGTPFGPLHTVALSLSSLQQPSNALAAIMMLYRPVPRWPTPSTHAANRASLSPAFFLSTNLPMVARALAKACAWAFSCGVLILGAGGGRIPAWAIWSLDGVRHHHYANFSGRMI